MVSAMFEVANYEFEEAIDYYGKAIAANPKRVDAYLNKASVLYQMGSLTKHYPFLNRLLKKMRGIKPIMANASYLKGNSIAGDVYLHNLSLL